VGLEKLQHSAPEPAPLLELVNMPVQNNQVLKYAPPICLRFQLALLLASCVQPAAPALALLRLRAPLATTRASVKRTAPHAKAVTSAPVLSLRTCRPAPMASTPLKGPNLAQHARQEKSAPVQGRSALVLQVPGLSLGRWPVSPATRATLVRWRQLHRLARLLSTLLTMPASTKPAPPANSDTNVTLIQKAYARRG